MAKIKEIWKDIPGFEGEYQASNLGQIRSLSRNVNCKHANGRQIKQKILVQIPTTKGYLTVNLGKNACGKRVHRLICMAFLPNPSNKETVNHKDGNKKNNHLSNLEWATQSENNLHAYRVLGRKPNATNLGGIPWNVKKIRQYKDGKFIREFATATEAAKAVNTCQGFVSSCARGEYASCKGFQFKYV